MPGGVSHSPAAPTVTAQIQAGGRVRTPRSTTTGVRSQAINLPLLVVCWSILTDSLWLQTDSPAKQGTPCPSSPHGGEERPPAGHPPEVGCRVTLRAAPQARRLASRRTASVSQGHKQPAGAYDLWVYSERLLVVADPNLEDGVTDVVICFDQGGGNSTNAAELPIEMRRKCSIYHFMLGNSAMFSLEQARRAMRTRTRGLCGARAGLGAGENSGCGSCRAPPTARRGTAPPWPSRRPRNSGRGA